MRRWIAGLRRSVVERFGDDPSRALYVFVNRKKDRLKVLWKAPTGWCVLYKHLDQGFRARLPEASGEARVVVDPRTMAAILEGVPLRGAARTDRQLARAARKKIAHVDDKSERVVI